MLCNLLFTINSIQLTEKNSLLMPKRQKFIKNCILLAKPFASIKKIKIAKSLVYRPQQICWSLINHIVNPASHNLDIIK